MAERPGSTVTAFRLTALLAQRRVRALAQSSDNLRWSQHIRERMEERGIDSEDVLRILRTGVVDSAPTQGKREGEWKIKVVRRLDGRRTAGVVTLLVNDSYLRLLTAEWEDGL